MTAGTFPGTGLFQRSAAAFAASVPADPVDDGYFGPGSVTWRVHLDLSAPVALPPAWTTRRTPGSVGIGGASPTLGQHREDA